MTAAAIMVGGACGALARMALSELMRAEGAAWPWGTLAANLLGALILGWLVVTLTRAVAPSPLWRPLVGTGFCGALTTFSTFQVEVIRIADEGRPGLAAVYALVSLAAGMACAAAGGALGRRR